MNSPLETIGLVPAAGMATRLSNLPFSKELYPVIIGNKQAGETLRAYSMDDCNFFGGEQNPLVVSQYLLGKMLIGGAQKIFVVLRRGKWDIADYYLEGGRVETKLAYIVLDSSPSVPHTVDAAYPFINNAMVLFGYPDILFNPSNAFEQLLERWRTTDSDVILGVFNLFPGQLTDRVELDDSGYLISINVRTTEPDTKMGWMIAAWTPEFTGYLHEKIDHVRVDRSTNNRNGELFFGHILQEAIRDGLKINSVVYRKHYFWDIGTPAGLKKALEDYKFWI